jgi:putative protein-disulfide isomerase
MTRLLYGYDPLCGWCYGFSPVLRHLRRTRPDLPIVPVMGGLVTGARIGPYAEMEGYIRAASARMTQVTGMALSPAFFTRITGNPAVVASSIVPCAAVLQVRRHAPDRAADFAAAIQEAHFGAGEDLNDPAVHDRVASALGLRMTFALPEPRHLPPDLSAEFAATRALGIASYPTLMMETPGGRVTLPTVYDPAALDAGIDRALAGFDPARAARGG